MLSIRQNQCKTIKSFIVVSIISLSNTYMERVISSSNQIHWLPSVLTIMLLNAFFMKKFISENVGMILSRRNFFGHLNSC